MNHLLKEIIDAAAPMYQGKISGTGIADRQRFSSIEEIDANHFTQYSTDDHPCRESLIFALRMLNEKQAIIIETGSSAWGSNSSLLFDSYVNSFGGSFRSVDIRLEPMINLQQICTKQSSFFCDDSVKFLRKIADTGEVADLIYLDSWDLNISDPLPSAIHGLNEFFEALPLIRSGTLLLIDDTPASINDWLRVQGDDTASFFEMSLKKYGFVPGKGALVKDYLSKNMIGKQLMHGYQLLWQF